jgi:hypothetical protein
MDRSASILLQVFKGGFQKLLTNARQKYIYTYIFFKEENGTAPIDRSI